MRVPSRSARRSAPFGAQRLTPVSVRTSRMSAAGRPTASPRAHPVKRSATGFNDKTVASRSTMIRAWGNCSRAWSASVRSLAMSLEYRRAQFRLQLPQPLLQLQGTGPQDLLVKTDVADGLPTEAGLEAIQAEPGMVRSGLLRDPPPVIRVTAHGSEVEHRLPVQRIIRHQLTLAVTGAAEQVVGGPAKTENHDPAERLALVLGEIKTHLVRRPEEVEGGLVVANAGKVDALPLAGLGRQPGEGGDITGAADPHPLLLRQVQVVAGLGLEAGLQRLRADVDPQQSRRLRLDSLGPDEAATFEEGGPLVTDHRTRLDPQHQPAARGRPPLHLAEDEQPFSLGH